VDSTGGDPINGGDTQWSAQKAERCAWIIEISTKEPVLQNKASLTYNPESPHGVRRGEKRIMGIGWIGGWAPRSISQTNRRALPWTLMLHSRRVRGSHFGRWIRVREQRPPSL